MIIYYNPLSLLLCQADLLVRDAIVPYEREGEGEDLMAVGGVGQTLHITHHTSLEHCRAREREREQPQCTAII